MNHKCIKINFSTTVSYYGFFFSFFMTASNESNFGRFDRSCRELVMPHQLVIAACALSRTNRHHCLRFLHNGPFRSRGKLSIPAYGVVVHITRNGFAELREPPWSNNIAYKSFGPAMSLIEFKAFCCINIPVVVQQTRSRSAPALQGTLFIPSRYL